MNEAKLTAYALGQLSEADRFEVEMQLVDDAARQGVNESRLVAEQLRTALAAEPLPESSPSLRATIERQLDAEPIAPARHDIPQPAHRRRVTFALVLAATLLLTIGMVVTWQLVDTITNVAVLPSAWWQTDDAQYFPPGHREKLESDVKQNYETWSELRNGTMKGWDADNDHDGIHDSLLDELGIGSSPKIVVQEESSPLRDLTKSYDLPVARGTKNFGVPLDDKWLDSSQPQTLFANPNNRSQEIGSSASAAGTNTVSTFMLNGGSVSTVNGDVDQVFINSAASNTPGLNRYTGATTVNAGSTGVSNGNSDVSTGAVKTGAGTLTLSGGTIAVFNSNGLSNRNAGASVQTFTVVRPGVRLAEPPQDREHNTEAYDSITENSFRKVVDHPLSTFSIDVDTASYSNVRRYLTSGQLPPPGAVRIEELVNYFSYDYPEPTGDRPFSVTTEVADCPWTPGHRLVRIGLKGRNVATEDRPASNLVFLLDVSGSMSDVNKLPLMKNSMRLLVNQLTERDRVAIVVYAGSSGLVLPSTTGDNKETIITSLDRLQSGGSTNGASGLTLAYQTARQHFITGGINRVILCTDGDFNVGLTSQDELVRLIETEAKSGVFLSALGFGMGNYKDSTLEKLADKGNGNYAYIDTPREARKVFVEQLSGTLMTIAKDVKIQIEFNPSKVGAYRLIGYENRVLAAEDFNNDKKDAGEIGAGHTVTALYELTGPGDAGNLPKVDALKYQQPKAAPATSQSDELLTVKLRYKQPDGDTSQLIESPLEASDKPFAQASGDFKFAASVAGFGMLLRHSSHVGQMTYDAALELAIEGKGADLQGHRAEYLDLLRAARTLQPKATAK